MFFDKALYNLTSMLLSWKIILSFSPCTLYAE